MGQGDRAREVFAAELALIQSPPIREFVIECFEKLCDPTWWDRVCSKSGKYHPKLAQGKGGLVRHVKYGVYWGFEQCRAYIGNGKAWTTDEIKLVDCVIAALIMHDMLKDGDPALAHLPERQGPKSYSLITGCHGVDLAYAIWNRVLGGKGTTEQVLICYGIACHMGVWTLPERFRPNGIEPELARSIAQIVHGADYAASRQIDGLFAKLTAEADVALKG